MSRKFFLCSLLVFFLNGLSFAAEPNPKGPSFANVAPFVNDETAAVGHVDLKQLNVRAAFDFNQTFMPEQNRPPEQTQNEALTTVETLVKALLENDVQHVFIVLRISDVFPRPTQKPLLVAAIPAGRQPADVVKKVAGKFGLDAPPANVDYAIVGQSVLIGPGPDVQALKNPKPVARPDLEQTFNDFGTPAARLAICLPNDARRVLREMVPTIPAEFGGGNGQTLDEGLKSVSLKFSIAPMRDFKLHITSKDTAAAEKLYQVIKQSLKTLATNDSLRRRIPEAEKAAKLLMPVIQREQIALNLDDRDGSLEDVLDAVVEPLASGTQAAAARSQSMNNMKQIMLAMHNFHDTFRKFPPRSTSSKDNRSLLSWRVQLLPFLEQQALYEEFHHDEPWDSEHNRKLIAKMPEVFASRALPPDVAKSGKTSYLAPVSENTIWSIATGCPIHQITDGTSNTIGIVEASPESAVIWTKPEDLTIDSKAPLKNLVGAWKAEQRILVSYCDGSVHALREMIAPATLLKLLSRNGGEIVEGAEF